VIELINRDFVAVWVNVRTTPLPRLPVIKDVLVNAEVNASNMIVDPFSEGFFLRSVVLTPDGQRILNRAATTVAGSLANIARDGNLQYAEVDGPDYLVMLTRARERFAAATP
jgi:hypothetical protein